MKRLNWASLGNRVPFAQKEAFLKELLAVLCSESAPRSMSPIHTKGYAGGQGAEPKGKEERRPVHHRSSFS